MRARIVDVIHIFGITFRTQWAKSALYHHFRKTDNGIERRSQFMRHICQKFGFGLIGAFGTFFFRLQTFVQFFNFGGALLGALTRKFQFLNKGIKPPLAIFQTFLLLFEFGNIGTNRNQTTVLRTTFVNFEPASVRHLADTGKIAGVIMFNRHFIDGRFCHCFDCCPLNTGL